MKIFYLLTFYFSVSILYAQSPVGVWKTIDDNTLKERSIVEIFEKDGKIYGKVKQIFPEEGEDPDPLCDKCTDHRKNKKVIGLQIMENLEKDGDEWSGGEILDPENGKVYRCKIWTEKNGKELKVRGYIAFFFRTQTWHKVE